MYTIEKECPSYGLKDGSKWLDYLSRGSVEIAFHCDSFFLFFLSRLHAICRILTHTPKIKTYAEIRNHTLK